MEAHMKFNIPYVVENQLDYMEKLLRNNSYQSGGQYSKATYQLLKDEFAIEDSYLVTSCTSALELTAMLIGIGEGDEIIMPSYTYVSTANAFVRQGGVPVFVETDNHFNMTLEGVKSSVTPKTKAVVIVHYGGAASDIFALKDYCLEMGIFLIEDAAQCMDSYEKGYHLGTIGDFGCISFHETKNIQCGEGGLLIVNNKSFLDQVALIVEKGTDKKKFINGLVDKYTWQGWGTSCLLSEVQCAMLYPQLLAHETITQKRKILWQAYAKELKKLINKGIRLVDNKQIANGHCFYLITRSQEERLALIDYLATRGIQGVSHFELLHLSDFAKDKYRFVGDSDKELLKSKSILRLPLHMKMTTIDVAYICDQVKGFYYEK